MPQLIPFYFKNQVNFMHSSPNALQALLIRAYDSLEWGLVSPPKPHSFVSLPLQSMNLVPSRILEIGYIRISNQRYRCYPSKNLSDWEREYPRSITDAYNSLTDPLEKAYASATKIGNTVEGPKAYNWWGISHILKIHRKLNETNHFTKEQHAEASKKGFKDAWEEKTYKLQLMEEHMAISQIEVDKTLGKSCFYLVDARPDKYVPEYLHSLSLKRQGERSLSPASENRIRELAKKGFDAASILDDFEPINHVVYPAVIIYLSGLFSDFLFYLFSFLNIFISLFVLCAIPFLCYAIYVFLYNKKNKKK